MIRIPVLLLSAALIAGCASAPEPPAPPPPPPPPPPVAEPAPEDTNEGIYIPPPVAEPVPEDTNEGIYTPPPAVAQPTPAPPEPVVAETPPPSRTIGQPEPMLPNEVEVVTASTAGECERVRAEGARRGDEWISCVSVFYGTNRAEEKTDERNITSKALDGRDRAQDIGDLFGIRPETRANCEPSPLDYSQTSSSKRVCHLGEIVVSVPDSRKKLLAKGGGAFKQARSGAALNDSELKKYFALLDHWSYDRDPDGFAARIQQVINASDPNEKHAFVFIHGFNVPFRNAAFRTAQLKYDMEIEGPAFFFSWPSNGSLLDYLSDQEDADLSVDALARYLRLVHSSVTDGERPMKLHIVAHSMGTRVTAQALARLADFESSPKFGHVVFAAGDLDANLFEEWMGASAPLYDGVTIYTSNTDAAVGFSRVLRNLSSNMQFWGAKNDDVKRRIGFYKKNGSPSVFDMPNADGEDRVKTIDVTKAAPFSFFFKVKHSTYAQSKSITDDIRCLFDLPFSDPDVRSHQFKRVSRDTSHWTYDPGIKDGATACQAAAGKTLP